jgi:hypothetical protein
MTIQKSILLFAAIFLSVAAQARETACYEGTKTDFYSTPSNREADGAPCAIARVEDGSEKYWKVFDSGCRQAVATSATVAMSDDAISRKPEVSFFFPIDPKPSHLMLHLKLDRETKAPLSFTYNYYRNQYVMDGADLTWKCVDLKAARF